MIRRFLASVSAAARSVGMRARSKAPIAAILCGVLLLAACAGQYGLRVNTIPQGAKIWSTGDTVYFYAPADFYWDLAGKVIDEKTGCYVVKGISAKWESGATVSTADRVTLCGKGNSWKITLQRPTDHPNLKTDLEVERKIVVAIGRQAERQRIEELQRRAAANAYLGNSLSFGIACAIGGCPKQGPPIYSYTPAATYGGSDSSENGCSSDYQCGYGNRCVKAPAASQGICLKSDDPLRTPSSSSVGPGSLRLGCGGLCPIGYHCDAKLQACVK